MKLTRTVQVPPAGIGPRQFPLTMKSRLVGDGLPTSSGTGLRLRSVTDFHALVVPTAAEKLSDLGL